MVLSSMHSCTNSSVRGCNSVILTCEGEKGGEKRAVGEKREVRRRRGGKRKRGAVRGAKGSMSSGEGAM